MFCTCYTINNTKISIKHTELLSRQTHKTPEPLFVQQASVGGTTQLTVMTQKKRHFQM
jgi:hypothetical protein